MSGRVISQYHFTDFVEQNLPCTYRTASWTMPQLPLCWKQAWNRKPKSSITG